MSTTTPTTGGGGAAPAAHDRCGVRAAAGGVPGYLDLEDPLPRGSGPAPPRRTRGGYRLFAEADVERLVTILRLQRDEFLPLRVIREELDAPAPAPEAQAARGLGERRGRSIWRSCANGRVSTRTSHALEEYGRLAPRIEGGDRIFERVRRHRRRLRSHRAHGIDARHLRTFRNAAGREAALLEQLVAPALRSRDVQRRKAGLDDLEPLADRAQELSRLLFGGSSGLAERCRAVARRGAGRPSRPGP